MKLLLFDLDGTLMLTGGAGLRAFSSTAVELFGEKFSFDGVVTGGGLDPMLFREGAQRSGLTVNDDDHERFRDLFLVRLAEELVRSSAGVRVMPGIITLLDDLRRCDNEVAIGLVTGNYTKAVPIKLGAVKIDHSWFHYNGFGDEADERAALVALAIERYHRARGDGLAAEDVIIIGDTPRDVACAKANGCLCLGVATGSTKVEQLREAGADLAVPDLADPSPLWELMGREISAEPR
jgi:phosphoglycolate phosphatase-like HAD superfamily hydrolase